MLLPFTTSVRSERSKKKPVMMMMKKKGSYDDCVLGELLPRSLAIVRHIFFIILRNSFFRTSFANVNKKYFRRHHLVGSGVVWWIKTKSFSSFFFGCRTVCLFLSNACAHDLPTHSPKKHILPLKAHDTKLFSSDSYTEHKVRMNSHRA